MSAVCLAAVLLCAVARGEPQTGWTWQLPVERYQRLDLSQRASVDRARELHARGETALERRQEKEAIASFRAAAAEWQRFTVAFMDAPESAMAYAQFMCAYSTHMAKDRNTAVKLYTEVLDFYPDTQFVAAPSLYWRGQAHADNGDQSKAVADWQALVEDETSAGHPLVAVALDRLASDDWGRGKWAEAAARWEEIASKYRGVARPMAESAVENLMMWRGFANRWSDVSAVAETARRDARGRADLANGFTWNAWNRSRNEWRRSYFERAFKGAEVDKQLEQYRRSLVEWFAGLSPMFDEAGRGWDHALAVFDYRRQIDPKKASELASALGKQLRGAALEPAERERRARGFIDRLGQAGMHTEARTLLDLIPDTVRRLWVAFAIEDRAADYKAALLVLSQLEQQPDPDVVRRAKRTRADVYKDKTNECDKAIPLYVEVADPPGTLWALQECFRRTGKKNEAQQTLTEIASIFPPEAARAMFQKAEYFERDNQKSEAIAHYRRLMVHPEWKRSPESSRAHQALERLGIATGGAVLHDVN